MNPVQRTALAPGANRVSAQPGRNQLASGREVKLLLRHPARRPVTPEIRPTKLANRLNRDDRGEIVGLTPSF
jgi:hypothetical protein